MLTLSGLDLSVATGLALLAAAFAAGWVDAVVGGGGLIQLPALLLVPGMSPVQALATNKVAGILGTSVSAATYARRVGVDGRVAGPMALAALAGAGGGALLAGSLPGGVIEPVVLVALVGVGVFVAARPHLGRTSHPRVTGAAAVVAAAGIGVVIGGYDGLVGPGTGTFLVFALVGVLGLSFLRASATAKVVNVATNLGALVAFALQGAPLWALGVAMGAANVAGAYLGARTAIARGSGFVRVVFLVVVGALVLTLAVDVLG